MRLEARDGRGFAGTVLEPVQDLGVRGATKGGALFLDLYKAFRHVETLFIKGRNLHLAGLLLVILGLFTFRQPIAGLQGTGFYLG